MEIEKTKEHVVKMKNNITLVLDKLEHLRELITNYHLLLDAYEGVERVIYKHLKNNCKVKKHD